MDNNEIPFYEMNQRKESIIIVKKRIEKEQLRQKNIYDKKVKLNS